MFVLFGFVFVRHTCPCPSRSRRLCLFSGRSTELRRQGRSCPTVPEAVRAVGARDRPGRLSGVPAGGHKVTSRRCLVLHSVGVHDMKPRSHACFCQGNLISFFFVVSPPNTSDGKNALLSFKNFFMLPNFRVIFFLPLTTEQWQSTINHPKPLFTASHKKQVWYN